MNCRFCGKSFNRRFNLSEYCPLQDHNSSIESGFDQSTGMSTKRKYADTDDFISESDSDHSDYTDEDQENEHETRAVARTLIGGGGVYIHIFGLCPTNFF